VFPSQQTGTTDNIPISPMSSQSNHFASKIVRVVHRTGYIIRVLRPSWLQVNLEIIQVAGTHCENQITVRWAPFSSRPGSDLGLLRGPSKREERASGIPQREIGPLVTGKKFGGLQGLALSTDGELGVWRVIGEILDFRLASRGSMQLPSKTRGSTPRFSIFAFSVSLYGQIFGHGDHMP
jgi:hypothetical protein